MRWRHTPAGQRTQLGSCDCRRRRQVATQVQRACPPACASAGSCRANQSRGPAQRRPAPAQGRWGSLTQEGSPPGHTSTGAAAHRPPGRPHPTACTARPCLAVKRVDGHLQACRCRHTGQRGSPTCTPSATQLGGAWQRSVWLAGPPLHATASAARRRQHGSTAHPLRRPAHRKASCARNPPPLRARLLRERTAAGRAVDNRRM